jgi:3-oxoadipate enol-lactonase
VTDVCEVGGIRLAYRVSGSPDAPPVVLMHALGENSTDWDAVAGDLAGTFRVYALDLRGHGASGRPGAYSVELMRDDLWAFLDRLGIDRVTLVGHSLGGMVACLAAQDRPERVARLVLEDPPPLLPADPPRPAPAQPDGPVDFDWAVVTGIMPQRNLPDPAWWDGLTRITAPTLVVAGGPDSHLPQDQLAALAARIPHGRLVTIPVGHLIHAVRPAEFVAAVRNFLAER